MDIIYDGVLQCYVAQIGDEVVCLGSETYEEAHEEAKAILDMYFWKFFVDKRIFLCMIVFVS